MKKLFCHNKMLSVLLFISLLICLSYIITYDMPEIINGIEKWYVLLYDFALAFIASYVFYVVQVFIPEENLKKIKQKEELPSRCAVYKEIKGFLESLLALWITLDKKEEPGNIKTIDQLFLTENIMQYASKIKMSESCGIIYLNLGGYIAWGDKIKLDTLAIRDKGLEILRFSKRDVPVSVYYSVYYIIHQGIFVNHLLYISSITPLTKLDTLWAGIGTFIENESKRKNSEIEHIKNIYRWLNDEYEYINSQLDDTELDTISKINCVHE